MPRNRDHNYGNAHGATVDSCGRCKVENAKGIRIVKPDALGDLPAVLELCNPCALNVAGDIASMVAFQLREGQ